jgi:nucleoid-associated protein YgaU
LLFALAALFVIGYMISAAWTHTGPFASAPAVAKSVVVTVAPGDTLWRLAGKYEAASLSGEDRLTRVRELNPNLDLSKPLVPGQHVRVPVATP